MDRLIPWAELLGDFGALSGFNSGNQGGKPVMKEIILPDPSDFFGKEYIPFRSSFKDFVAAVKDQEDRLKNKEKEHES